MRTWIVAVCLLPFPTAAQAEHRTLAQACVVAAGQVVSGKHATTVKAVGTGSTPVVRLEIQSVSGDASLPARCSFASDEPPFEITRVCVASACYSESASFESRRETFEELREQLGH